MGGTTSRGQAVCDAIRSASAEVAARCLARVASVMSEAGQQGDWQVFTRCCDLVTRLAEGPEPGPGEALLCGAEDAILRHLLRGLPRLLLCESHTQRSLVQPAVMSALGLVRVYIRKRRLLRAKVVDVASVLAAMAALPYMLASGRVRGPPAEALYVAAATTLSVILRHHARLVYTCSAPFVLLARGLFRTLTQRGAVVSAVW